MGIRGKLALLVPGLVAVTVIGVALGVTDHQRREQTEEMRTRHQLLLEAVGVTAAVYVADTLPTSFEGWGEPVDTSYNTEATTASFNLGRPGTYVLVSLQQLAEDPDCTQANPFRGRISEISFQPAP